MHINTTAQEIIAGRAIQAIYGSFQAHPYKVIKVVKLNKPTFIKIPIISFIAVLFGYCFC